MREDGALGEEGSEVILQEGERFEEKAGEKVSLKKRRIKEEKERKNLESQVVQGL